MEPGRGVGGARLGLGVQCVGEAMDVAKVFGGVGVVGVVGEKRHAARGDAPCAMRHESCRMPQALNTMGMAAGSSGEKGQRRRERPSEMGTALEYRRLQLALLGRG
jgi:hypothetical protein